MQIAVVLIFMAVAGLALAIAFHSGYIKNKTQAIVAVLGIVCAFGLRFIMMNHVTLDYTDFLSRWLLHFRENGGFLAIPTYRGNYNVPYIYFLSLISGSNLYGLHLIKLFSIFFDVILAWGCALTVGLFKKSPAYGLATFLSVLLLPTVILNGAAWGQCDSVYVAFAVFSVYFALSKRPELSVAFIALSFAFKLQAVFIMPVFAVFLFTGRIKFRHIFIFPATYLLLVLPAVLLGKPLIDTITLYFTQLDTVGGGYNYNSPSVFAFFRGPAVQAVSFLFILICANLTALVIYLASKNGKKTSDLTLLTAAALFSVLVPFILPHMHDRYFFPADIMTLIYAFVLPEFFALPVLSQFASLLGYHAYLKRRYFLPMHYGAFILVFVIASLFVSLCFMSRADRLSYLFSLGEDGDLSGSESRPVAAAASDTDTQV
ncbi:MAG: hypothetical protein GX684_02255 [Ruminococcaceae bacterium]|nr:hypothetical protein [Oscillospiraceae bacterium]